MFYHVLSVSFICKSNLCTCGSVMAQYWQDKLGAGESIIILKDDIECALSYPTNENYATFNAHSDCEVIIRQFTEETMDCTPFTVRTKSGEYTFPATLKTHYNETSFLAHNLKIILKNIKENIQEQCYEETEIFDGILFLKKGDNEYYLNDIMITDMTQFLDVMMELLSVYNEMSEKCVH